MLCRPAGAPLSQVFFFFLFLSAWHLILDADKLRGGDLTDLFHIIILHSTVEQGEVCLAGSTDASKSFTYRCVCICMYRGSGYGGVEAADGPARVVVE